MNDRRRRGLVVTALSLAVVLGAMLRFGFASRGGVWRDEAQLLDVASLPSARVMMEFLVQHESHPPLYYLMMRWWIELAGPSDPAVLIPGITFGVLTIVASWWCGKTVGGSWAGLTGATLVALNPRLIQASGMARPYAFLSFLLILGVMALVHGMVREGRRSLIAFAVIAITLLYTHNWTLLPLAAMALIALVVTWGGHTRSSPIQLGILALVILAGWSPWLPSLVYQTQHAGHFRTAADPILSAPYFGLFILPGLSPVATVIALSTVGGVVWLRLRHGAGPSESTERIGVLVAAWTPAIAIVLAALGSYRTRLLVEHAVTMLTPLVLISIALVLTREEPLTRWHARIALAAVLLVSLVNGVSASRQQRSNVEEAARFIAARAKPDDMILLLPPFHLASSLARYRPGPAPVFCYPVGFLSLPLSFTDRAALDRNPEAVASADQHILEVLARGATVWEVSIGRLDYMLATTERLEQLMLQLAGPPVDMPAFPRATEENVRVRTWRAGPASPQVGGAR